MEPLVRASQRVAALAASHGNAAELARYASLAVRIDAPLLRRLRLTLLRGADASAEAELWFSALSESRGDDGLVLDPDVAELLRMRLASEQLPDGRRALEVVWRETSELHMGWPESLRLEEQLTYLALSEGRDAGPVIEAALQPAMVAMASSEQRALEVARWVMRAMPRLPPAARDNDAVLALSLAAMAVLNTGANPMAGRVPRELPPSLGWMLSSSSSVFAKRVQLVCEATRSGLRLRAARSDDAGDALISVPSTRPLVLELRWRLGGKPHSKLHLVQHESVLPFPSGARELQLRTLDGALYAIHRPVRVRRPLPPTRPPGDRMAPQTAVYIIHSSAEAALVRHLTGFIDEAFRGRIAAFSSIDVGGISAGANWIQDITGALDRARMVLCLYGSPTKEGREWMNFELGAAWMKGVPIIPLCHSGQTLAGLPMPLALAQGVELGSENGLRRLHEALARMLDERSEPPRLDGYLALFRDFERHYVGAPRVVHFGRSLDIDLDPGSPMPNAGLPADAVVNSNALEMFGLSGSETTWGRFADRARAMNSDMRWLRELEQSIQLAHADQAFRPAMAVCHTGDGAYQPHLSRKEGLPNGGSRFHVQWFETVAVRMSDFASDVGLLSTLLRLGLRLRYEVVEHFQQRLAVDRSRTGYPDLQPLRRAFETIETEARSLGSERMDTSAVLGLLAGPAEREQLQYAQERWDEARAALFRSDPPLPVADVELHLRALGTANAQMMLLVTRRLHDVVRTQWGVPVPGVPVPP